MKSPIVSRAAHRFISRNLALVIVMAAMLAAVFMGPIAGAVAASFAAKQDFGTGSVPVSVTMGDVNGDGQLDLVVANSNSSTVSVLLNTTAPGAGTPTWEM